MRSIYFLVLFVIPILSHSLSYKQFNLKDSSIRGYQFGTKLSTIRQQEAQKNEFVLIPAQSNDHQLSYQGTFLSYPVTLVYRFTKSRLSSITYYWHLAKQIKFSSKLQNTLKEKYQLLQTHNSENTHHRMTLEEYGAFKDEVQILAINLEIIQELSQENISYILEYYSLDSEEIIKQRILTEDL